MSSAAPTRSRQAIATWPTMISAARARRRRSDGAADRRDTVLGQRLDQIDAARMPRRARARRRRSREPTRQRKRQRAACRARRHPVAEIRRAAATAASVEAPAASASPAAPPHSPTIALSISNCLTMRRCPAPMAARTAISRRRTVARASWRLATLAVAVISRRATAASSTRIAGLTSAVIACSSGTADTSIGPAAPNSALAATPMSGALRARDVASAAACSGVAPARKRAIARKITPTRAPLFAHHRRYAPRRPRRVSRSGNAKSRGITPTIV